MRRHPFRTSISANSIRCSTRSSGAGRLRIDTLARFDGHRDTARMTTPRSAIASLHAEINPNKTAAVRELGPVDLGAVPAAVVATPDEAWDTADDYEANYNKRGALRDAAHIILRFCDRRERPALCYDLPAWAQWQAQLRPIMDAAVKPYGYARGFYPRIMLAKLPAGAFVAPHVDGDPSGNRPHKIHVPLLTNADTYFFVADQRYHFVEGHAYEVNNAARHSAVNSGRSDRVHLIFEYLDASLQPFADPPDIP